MNEYMQLRESMFTSIKKACYKKGSNSLSWNEVVAAFPHNYKNNALRMVKELWYDNKVSVEWSGFKPIAVTIALKDLKGVLDGEAELVEHIKQLITNEDDLGLNIIVQKIGRNSHISDPNCLKLLFQVYKEKLRAEVTFTDNSKAGNNGIDGYVVHFINQE